MDPASPSPSFDTTGSTPYMYVYFMNRLLSRSIQRVPVEIW